MHRVTGFVLILLACASSALAQLPPLVDRNLFFGDPEISGSQISPDGRFITFLKPFHGVRNIWLKTVAGSFDSARPITADSARPVNGYFWSLDSKYVIYAQDKGGTRTTGSTGSIPLPRDRCLPRATLLPWRRSAPR